MKQECAMIGCKNKQDKWLIECGAVNAGFCNECNKENPPLQDMWKMERVEPTFLSGNNKNE